MKRILFLIVSITLVGCSPKTIGYSERLKNPKLEKLWETDTILSDLESAIYDSKSNSIYVTNINGHWLKPNGKGFISKVSLEGEIINHKWIENIEGPTGMALYNRKLYVADFDAILEIDIDNQKIVKKYNIDGTERINDLTVTKEGTVYGSGTIKGKLIALKKGKSIVVKDSLSWPNGVLVEGDNILIGLGDKSIENYNLKTKNSKILAKGISNPDGIAAIGNGDYLISSWEGLIHYVTKEGKKILMLDTSKEKVNAADITYIPSKKIVLVPAMLKHKLIAYRLTDEK